MKWNLVNEYSGGEVVDVVEGPYELANRKARKIESEKDIKITIYQTM